MTTNPPGTPGPASEAGSDAGPGADPGPSPYDGPRVSRDEVKDLGRLRRSSTDRKVAGVAAGIARHLDIDPLVVRIAFVVLAFFGGGGILLYAACWVFVPDEATGEAAIHMDERSRTVVLGLSAIIALGSAVGDSLGGWGFPWPLMVLAGAAVIYYLVKNAQPHRHPGPLPTPFQPSPTATGPTPDEDVPPGSGGPYGATYAGYRPPHRRPVNPLKRGPLLFWFTMALATVGVGMVLMLQLAGWHVPAAAYPATVMAACGLMLLVGAFYGRGGGLIFVGLVAALATVFASAAGEIEAGQELATPSSAAELDDAYDLGAGEIKIDLTELDDDELALLDGRALDLDVTFGAIKVVVPDEGLDVTATGTVEVGEVKLFGNKSSTTDTVSLNGGESAPELDIDADVVFGEVKIETEGAAR